jgi:uncharacterized metal-binding protein
MRMCANHGVAMVRRAHVLRARGGWRIWTFFACPVRSCSAKRTQKRGGDPVFHNKDFAEAEAARINRGTLLQ